MPEKRPFKGRGWGCLSTGNQLSTSQCSLMSCSQALGDRECISASSKHSGLGAAFSNDTSINISSRGKFEKHAGESTSCKAFLPDANSPAQKRQGCSLQVFCCFEANHLHLKTADTETACRPSVHLSGWKEKYLKAKMEASFCIFFPFRILQLAGELHDTEKNMQAPNRIKGKGRKYK